MLSKVLKGEDARQIPPMSFTVATQARQPMPQSAHTGNSSGGPERTDLLEKIQKLEAGMIIAKREAFEAGQIEGEKQARAQLAPVLDRMNASIAEVIELRPELRRRAEKDAVELALQIARRVLHREIAIDGTALNALARVIFDRLARSESWQMTVHPRFADAISGALPATAINRVQINADPSCAPGTLIVRCAEGVIDASIESQMEEIGRGLTDRLGRR
jgi:flagellar assembly protein FliH